MANAFGREFDWTRQFFRPRSDFGLACFSPERSPFPYHVLIHAPDDIAGVCDQTEEEFALSSTDLVMYELNRPVLNHAIADAFGFADAQTTVAKSPEWTDRLGCYLPAAGHKFPAYLSICCHAADFYSAVVHLAAANQPFLLLAPTCRYLSPMVQALMQQCNASFVPLGEVLALDDDKNLIAKPTASALLEKFAVMAVAADHPTEPTNQQNEFCRTGITWQIRFENISVSLRDSKGLRYLAYLLAHPGEPVYCAKIFAAAVKDPHCIATGSSGADLDADAVAAYRLQIAELEAELAESRFFNDTGKQEAIQAELDCLVSKITAALGLGGRIREHSDADRFRKSVRMAVARAIETVNKAHPLLGRHLMSAIHTGRFLVYSPNTPVYWVV